MNKFEQQFEDLDIQRRFLENVISQTVTKTIH